MPKSHDLIAKVFVSRTRGSESADRAGCGFEGRKTHAESACFMRLQCAVLRTDARRVPSGGRGLPLVDPWHRLNQGYE